MTRKLEPGRYIVTDISSGKALDLSLDSTRLQAFDFHGENNQQASITTLLLTLGEEELISPPSPLADLVTTVRRRTRALHCVRFHATHIIMCCNAVCQWEFSPCGTGFIINNIRANGLFVAVQDLNNLHLEGSTKAIPGSLPMCWNVELLPPGPTDTEPEEVLVRYVRPSDLEGCGVMLRHEGTDITQTSYVGHAFSIWLPYTKEIQLTLGFKGSQLRAPVSAVKNLTSYLSIFTDSGPHSFSWERMCAPSGGCAQWGIATSKS